MKIILNRRGQTEDFFADLIIAVIIVVLAIILLSILNTAHDTNIKERIDGVISGNLKIKSADVKLASEIDFITLLRTEWKTDETIQEAFIRMNTEGKTQCDSDLQRYLDELFTEYYTERWNFDLIDNEKLLVSCRSISHAEIISSSFDTLVPFPLENGEIVYAEVRLYE